MVSLKMLHYDLGNNYYIYKFVDLSISHFFWQRLRLLKLNFYDFFLCSVKIKILEKGHLEDMYRLPVYHI